MRSLIASIAFVLLASSTLAEGATTFYVAQYNNSITYPNHPGCRVATKEEFQSQEFRDQYNRGALKRLGSINSAVNCALMVQTSTTDSKLGCLQAGGKSVAPYTAVSTNSRGLCFGEYPSEMNLGGWPNQPPWASEDPWYSMSSNIQASARVSGHVDPTWTGPTVALVRCDGEAPPSTPTPSSPPPPSPSSYTLIQSECTDSYCLKSSCKNTTLPTGQCLRVNTGFAASARVECSATALVEKFYKTNDCSGPSQTISAPLDTCGYSSPGVYVENYCVMNQAHTDGNLFYRSLHTLSSSSSSVGTAVEEKEPLHFMKEKKKKTALLRKNNIQEGDQTTNNNATFYIGRFNASSYPKSNCRIATLSDFQSKEFRDQYNSDTLLPRLGEMSEYYLNCAVMAMDDATGNVGCLRDEFFYQTYQPYATGFNSWACGLPYGEAPGGKGFPSKMRLGGWKRSTFDFATMTQEKQMGTYVDYTIFPPQYAGPTAALIRCDGNEN